MCFLFGMLLHFYVVYNERMLLCNNSQHSRADFWEQKGLTSFSGSVPKHLLSTSFPSTGMQHFSSRSGWSSGSKVENEGLEIWLLGKQSLKHGTCPVGQADWLPVGPI